MNKAFNFNSFLIKNKYNIFYLGIIFTFIFTWLYIPLSWDDSYISYRYALNLVNGNHWNWNNDNDVVEAYTNFSYAVLSIVPIYIKIDPTIFFKFLNLIWIVILFYRLKKDLKSFSLFFISMMILIFNPYVHYHAATGMETMFFFFLIFESGRCVLLDSKNKEHEKYFYILLLMLPLTRPEGIVYSIVFFILYIKDGFSTIKSKKTIILLFLIAITYMFCRYSYFGKLFPNTFYLKSIKGLGIGNFIKFIDDSKLYFLALIILNFIIKNKNFLIISILTASIALLVYAPADLNTTINDRFTIQIFLPIFLLSLYLVDPFQYKKLLILFIIFIASRYYDYSKIITFNPQSYYYREVGETLNKYSKNNYSLMIGEAGIIPYYSNLKTYDFIGLANTELSTKKITVEYVRKISPDIIFLYGSGKGEDEINSNFYSQDIIVKYMKEVNQYNFIGNLNNREWCLKIFVKKSIKDYTPLKADLESILNKTYEYYGQSLYNKKNIYNWLMLNYIK
jgi:arabinofuranosyltransferase